MAEDTSGIDYTALGGLSQEEVNKRILAAMLQQGSSRFDQMMLADTLGRSRGPVPLGPRGRGKVGEMNDFMTAMRPGMERAQAMEMVKQLREKDMDTMRKILGGGAPQAGAGAANPYAMTGAPPAMPGALPSAAPTSGVGLTPTEVPQTGLLNKPRNKLDLGLGYRPEDEPPGY